MTFKIPLSLQPQSSVIAPTAGRDMTLPLNAGWLWGSRASTASARELQALRAVAVAASLSDPQAALEIAKQARDNPGQSIGMAVQGRDYLALVLNAVVRAQENPSQAPGPDDQQRAVARVIGADPGLVAAAAAELRGNRDKIGSSLFWVASVDLDLLDRSARAAARETLLDLIPSQQTRLERLEERVDDLSQQVAGLVTSKKRQTP